MIFLSLLSYSLLFADRGNITGYDIIVFIIATSMLIEEVHQVKENYAFRSIITTYVSVNQVLIMHTTVKPL